MSKTIASIVLLVTTLIGIQVLLLLNERWAGPSSQELIDQLVTTNPRTRGNWEEKPPVGWNADEDARVWRIWQKLKKEALRRSVWVCFLAQNGKPTTHRRRGDAEFR